ncbi:cell wall-binding repeat-containing protein [Clostridium sp. CX1]|uniref:cell wall-binding repeat-containing protein n=1 Tax=Clostridium sp. CX1 TaxID=2978346 RepID=UPI0021BED418|nr:cell wall-binding repeat-containing protein [Clostridium sp. CX1]MCT8976991.1 cell wall-binding repeat-containing protein [Clostridium sp. CX1]
MKKRLLMSISTAIVSCLIFFTSSVVKAATLQDRLWGNDRYETNSKIVSSGWTSSQYAVIASGEGFADALCAAPLAKQYKAPILLTSKNALGIESKDQLLKLKVEKVFIIGGTGVVSDNVKAELENMRIETTRIYGQDRFETAIEVAKNLENTTGVVVTNGYGFADSLSIAPIAAQKGMPILLTDKDDLPIVTKNFLANKTFMENYIIGGTGVVGTKIDSYLNNSVRLGGLSRYETNSAVLDYFADKFNYDKVYVASGENYPDALSGSVLASSSNSPLILVGNSVDSSVMESIKAQHNKYNNVIILGGTAVVSDASVNSIVTGVGSSFEVSETMERIKRTGKLVLGTSADYPPYEFHKSVNGKDQIVGFDIEIAKEIAKDLGVQLEIIDMQFDRLLAALDQGKVDLVISGISPTIERQKHVDFSDIYYEEVQNVIVRTADKNKFRSDTDFNGKILGVQKGSIEEAIVKEKIPLAEPMESTTVSDLVLALKNYKADGVVLRTPIAKAYVDGDIVISDIKLSAEYTGSAAAMKKGSTDLVKEVNRTLDRLKDSNSIDKFVIDASNSITY